MITDISVYLVSLFILLHLATLLSERRDFAVSAGFRTPVPHEFILIPDVGRAGGGALFWQEDTEE